MPIPTRQKRAYNKEIYNESKLKKSRMLNTTVLENYCGNIHGKQCSLCSANFFPGENMSKCCNNGVLTTIPPSQAMDAYIRGLFESDTKFCSLARVYNNALSLASTSFVEPQFTSPGPPTVIVNGEVRHYMSPVRSGCFGGMYTLDPADAVDGRLRFSELDKDIVANIDAILRAKNPYAKSYRLMHEVCKQFPSSRVVRMYFIADSLKKFGNTVVGRNCGSFVLNEVAVVYTGLEDIAELKREMCLYSNTMEPKKINHMRSQIDPLCYTLFFPNGEEGFNIHMKDRSGKKISERRFYLHRLMYRNEVFSVFFYGRKLFCQYVCDAWVRIETNRLEYVRRHQSRIRAELYSGVRDQMASNSFESGKPIGKCLILPSTFEGSARQRNERFHDSMALVRYYGKPDYFITFTANPNWLEITESLLPSQNPIDRPDVVARVFKLKIESFMESITQGKIFGKVEGFNYVVEFQGRGLPHIHLLLYIHPTDKPYTPEQIDSTISAELPDPICDSRLHEIIVTHNVHTCSIGRCIDDKGVCSKNFPKPFSEQTTVDSNSFPLYKRSCQSSYRMGNGKIVTNSHIVPYNPILSQTFSAHVNVECCNTVNSIKYVNMYMHKGTPDAHAFGIESSGVDHDEITSYVRSRYVGSIEAYWRICGFPLFGMSHSVIRLSVHLPGSNLVFFDPNSVENIQCKPTTLTAFFKLNESDSFARTLLYSDIPLYYTWTNYKWNRRKNKKTNATLSRLSAVKPNDMERYCLRLLLLHVRGPLSFEGLKLGCSTFKEAAILTGLLDDDKQWEECLKEASITCTPRQFRKLFCVILVHCSPKEPRTLWDMFQDNFLDQYSPFTSTGSALREIHLFLENFNLTLDKFGLPPVDESERSGPPGEAPQTSSVDLVRDKLSVEQKNAFDQVHLSLLRSVGEGSCFYVDGPGGSGKTFLYNALLDLADIIGLSAISSAYTGIAGSLLRNGSTIHRNYAVPISGESSSLSTLSYQSKEADTIRKASLLIFDEATMIPYWMFRYVDHLLRDLLQVDRPFGGKTVVFGGDFRQCLPITPINTKERVLAECIRSSPVFRTFIHLRLSKNMRVDKPDGPFSKWLLEVGAGTSGQFVEIPETNLVGSCSELIQTVFESYLGPHGGHALMRRSILAVCNSTVDQINEIVINKFHGRMKTYYSQDVIMKSDGIEELTDADEAVLHTLNCPGLPPHSLHLKIGCPVILIRNINVSAGLCNGTRMIITKLCETHVFAKIPGTTENHVLPRVPISTEDTSLPFNFQRTQLPLKLAFAMTINKSQGQTLERVGVNLEKEVISHGQLYVAFSRVRNQSSLSVYIGGKKRGESETRTRTLNIVYKEVLV